MKAPVFHRRFDYKRTLLPNAHLAALEEVVSDIPTARTRTGASIGYPGWGLIYHLLLSHLDPQRHELIVETGTNEGCTAIILAQALRDYGGKGRLLTFELEPENITRASENLRKAGLSDLVEIIEGDTRRTLPDKLQGIEGIRFCFLDASHLFEDVLHEFETVLPHLSDDALVLLDNTYGIADEGEDQRVNGFLKVLPERFGGNLINLEFVSWFTPGLAIWQKQPKL